MTGLISNIVFPFVALFILNGSTVLLTKRSFGKCLPVTMMGIVYVLYFSQIFFNTFLHGFIVIGLFPVIILALVVCRRIVPEYELILTDGLTAFIIIYIFFNILNFNKWVLICDEFTHWGPMVKEMVRLDRFYCVPESILRIHKEYPPFLSLFEFFWVKICGNYSEMGATTALNVFEFLIITASILEKNSAFKRDDWIRVLLKFLAFLLIVVIFDPHCLLTTVYKDLALPIIFCYSISLLIDGSAVSTFFGCVSFAMSMGALLMTKELGITFTVLSVAAYMICVLRSLRLCMTSVKKAIIMLITVITLPVLMNLCWKNYVYKYLGMNSGQFSLSKISPAILIGVVSGTDDGIRHVVLLDYIKALIKTPISGIISVTFFTSFVMVLLLLFVIWKTYRNRFNYINAIGLALMFTAGTVGFALTMGILYQFCFSEEEMLNLASYSRYMSSYVLGEVLILMVLFLTLWTIEKDIRNIIKESVIVLALVFLITFAPATTTWIPQSMRKGPFKTVNAEVAEQAYVYADRIKEHTEKGSKILFLIGDSGWFEPAYTRYLVNDRLVEYAETTNDIKMISENNYLLVIEKDHDLESMLSPFCNGGKLKENIIYRVANDIGDIQLVEIE